MSSSNLEILPESNEQYGAKEYWDYRYAQADKEDSFDWFKSYSQVSGILAELIPNKTSRILMLGCGNSKLSEEMYDDGYHNIVNIDYSSVVIQQMKTRRPEMEWYEMDIRDLKFERATFDIAIDKGTMDAMMTSKGNVWDPPQDVIDNCSKEIDEVIRVVKTGGRFLYLTFGQPHFRRRYLTRPDTTLEIRELGEAFHYYFYIVHIM